MTSRKPGSAAKLKALEKAIDEYAPAFQKLRGRSDLAGYLAAKGDQADEEILTERLLREGRELVERVERLVCAIYDVPDDLTEQVVAHTVRRSG